MRTSKINHDSENIQAHKKWDSEKSNISQVMEFYPEEDSQNELYRYELLDILFLFCEVPPCVDAVVILKVVFGLFVLIDGLRLINVGHKFRFQ